MSRIVSIKQTLLAVGRQFGRGWRTRRRASVLILVVALLVLLALIGTAFITAASNDRDSATQHRVNTEIDLLARGVLDMMRGRLAATITATENNKPSFRSAPNPLIAENALDASLAPINYTPVTNVRWDSTLADRYPQYANANDPHWLSISSSPFAIPPDPTDKTKVGLSQDQWSSPLVGQKITDTNGNNYQFVEHASTRHMLRPTGLQIIYPSGATRVLPVFLLDGNASVAPLDANNGSYIVAADADGDGISDAGLFELPFGQINGIRYYGAVRVIDHNSAVNASVAMESIPLSGLSTEQQRLPVDVFPTNVNFRKWIDGDLATAGDGTDDQNDASGVLPWNRFNSERFGYTAPAAPPMASLTPIRDDLLAPNFQFATQYDAFWTMLGSRMDNPGINPSINNTTRYRALGLRDSVAMASRFCLPTQGMASSTLERCFPHGTGMDTTSTIHRDPYFPGEVDEWYKNIFDYANLATTPKEMPLRPLVTGHNPVNNFAPSYSATLYTEQQRRGRYQYRGAWATNQQYAVGEWVTFATNPPAKFPIIGNSPVTNATPPASTMSQMSFVCVRNHTSAAANVPLNSTTSPIHFNLDYWAVAPWTDSPTKINPNTASFGELYAAYSGIMFDGPQARPTATSDAAAFGSPFPQEDYWTLGNVMRPTSGGNPKRYLESTIQSMNDAVPSNPAEVASTFTTTAQYNSYLTRQLRTGLAAVNNIDLRDQDDDVTSRTIALTLPSGAVVRTANVYGTERQPYLTEACVHIDDMRQWVAIELYNPYPFALRLDAFRLAYRDRTAGSMLTEIIKLNTVNTANPYIPAGGYLVMENAQGARPDDKPTQNALDAIDADTVNGPIHQVPALGDLLTGGGNRELYLLRTRAFSGVVNKNTDLANQFDENLLEDLVPVDQLEFSGLIQQPSPDDATHYVPTRYHYRRANSSTASWNFVYSGPYNPTPTGGERRQRGWIRDPLEPVPPDPTIYYVQVPGFTQAKNNSGAAPPHNQTTAGVTPSNASTFKTRTLQVANVGMAGPWSPLTTERAGLGAFASDPAGPLFPCGQFLRNGDLLQVPFIGGYKIVDKDLSELNSVSLDASFADDGDDNDDADEQLGRFCPIISVNNAGVIKDVNDRPNFNPASPPTDTRYHWAMDLFDYFNVLSPQDDFLANVDADGWLRPNGSSYDVVSGDPTISASTGSYPSMQKWPQESSASNTPAVAPGLMPPPVANTLARTANYGREDTAGVQGLINVNTANFQVLSLLPYTSNVTQNIKIANEIIQYRNTVGPFRNLFELLSLPSINSFNPASNPGVPEGDVSPLPVSIPSATTDGVSGDFEAKYLIINRISNMVTFQSDTFTVYVLVQGWKNAGTAVPELVAQRRIAQIVDRTSIRPVNGTPGAGVAGYTNATSTNVPQ